MKFLKQKKKETKAYINDPSRTEEVIVPTVPSPTEEINVPTVPNSKTREIIKEMEHTFHRSELRIKAQQQEQIELHKDSYTETRKEYSAQQLYYLFRYKIEEIPPLFWEKTDRIKKIQKSTDSETTQCLIDFIMKTKHTDLRDLYEHYMSYTGEETYKDYEKLRFIKKNPA